MNNRVVGQRGSALLGVLAITLILQALVAMMLLASISRVRLIRDQRWAIEGRLIATSTLATSRLHFATGAVLPEGEAIQRTGTRPDGWLWSTVAIRHGDLVRITALVARNGPDGLPFAGARAVLFLRRLPSDTLRLIPAGARF